MTSTPVSSFVYDPWVLYARGFITAPNVVLAGIVGAGKSALAKSLYTRSIPLGRDVYVPGDPKGEHTAVAEAVGGKAILLGHAWPTVSTRSTRATARPGSMTSRLGAQVTSRRRDLIGALAETVLDRRLTPPSTSRSPGPLAPHRCRCYRWSSTGSSISEGADDPDGRLAEDGRLVGHALRRLVAGDLAGLFDAPSTVRFDLSPPMICLDLSRVTEKATQALILTPRVLSGLTSGTRCPTRLQRGIAAQASDQPRTTPLAASKSSTPIDRSGRSQRLR